MSQPENRNPERRLYHTETQQVVRHTHVGREIIYNTLLRGVVVDKPFSDALGKGKRMLGFTVRGNIRGADKETEYQVRVFGRRAARRIVTEGSEFPLFGHLQIFLEKNSEGEFVPGTYFIVAPNGF